MEVKGELVLVIRVINCCVCFTSFSCWLYWIVSCWYTQTSAHACYTKWGIACEFIAGQSRAAHRWTRKCSIVKLEGVGWPLLTHDQIFYCLFATTSGILVVLAVSHLTRVPWFNTASRKWSRLSHVASGLAMCHQVLNIPQVTLDDKSG